MKLIDEWKSAYKLWSVRLAGLTAAVSGMDWLLPNLAGEIPKGVYFALAMLIVLARVVQQVKELPDASADPTEK